MALAIGILITTGLLDATRTALFPRTGLVAASAKRVGHLYQPVTDTIIGQESCAPAAEAAGMQLKDTGLSPSDSTMIATPTRSTNHVLRRRLRRGLVLTSSSMVARYAWQSAGGWWKAYEAAALARPLVTKSATSGVAYLAGDAIAQRCAGTRSTGRLVRACIAGTVSHGPQLHMWTALLARLHLGVVTSIVLDQTIFALYINAAFCVLTEALQRRPLGAALRKAKEAAWPCLTAGWRFWPAAHALTYSVVPLHLRVLWVDVLEIAWVAILSTNVAKSYCSKSLQAIPKAR